MWIFYKSHCKYVKKTLNINCIAGNQASTVPTAIQLVFDLLKLHICCPNPTMGKQFLYGH